MYQRRFDLRLDHPKRQHRQPMAQVDHLLKALREIGRRRPSLTKRLNRPGTDIHWIQLSLVTQSGDL